jgi:hypothetical protein
MKPDTFHYTNHTMRPVENTKINVMLCPKFTTSEGTNNNSLTPHRPGLEATVELNLWLKLRTQTRYHNGGRCLRMTCQFSREYL